MLGCEHEGETTLWLRVEPRLGLLRDVRGMVVEDQLDGRLDADKPRRAFEEADELPRTMALLHAGVNLPVNKSIPANRLSVPWRMYSWSRATQSLLSRLSAASRVQCSDGLDAGLFIVGDDRDRWCFGGSCPPDASTTRPRDRRTAPRPSSLRTSRRGVRDSSEPCAASSRGGEDFAQLCPEHDCSTGKGVLQPAACSRTCRVSNRVVHNLVRISEFLRLPASKIDTRVLASSVISAAFQAADCRQAPL